MMANTKITYIGIQIGRERSGDGHRDIKNRVLLLIFRRLVLYRYANFSILISLFEWPIEIILAAYF